MPTKSCGLSNWTWVRKRTDNAKGWLKHNLMFLVLNLTLSFYMLFVLKCCGTEVNVGKAAKNNSITNNENVIKIQNGCRFLVSSCSFLLKRNSASYVNVQLKCINVSPTSSTYLIFYFLHIIARCYNYFVEKKQKIL